MSRFFTTAEIETFISDVTTDRDQQGEPLGPGSIPGRYGRARGGRIARSG
jgi:hypothetical protein